MKTKLQLVKQVLLFPIYLIASLAGTLWFYVETGFKAGYNHYN